MNRAKKGLRAQVLDLMEKAFRVGYEIALHDAVVFCHENKQHLPDWALTELAFRSESAMRGEKPKKKMGRHAQPRTKHDQVVADALCFELVTEWRGRQDPKLHGEDAFSAAGKELNLDRETAKKNYYRHKNRIGKQMFYVGLLFCDGDYVRYLQYNHKLLGW